MKLLKGSMGAAHRSSFLLWTIVLAIGGLQNVRASFLGDYALGNFTLTNINSDGSAASPDNGLSLVLTGPNNGSNSQGITNFGITLPSSGTVEFQYLYSSLDLPAFDYAGYFLGSIFVQLADTDGQSGNVLLPVTAGQTFGFRIVSLDNIGEPGILTVSDFTAPPGPGAVPEPGTLSLLLVALGGVLGLRRWTRATSARAVRP